jgi:hypothetical protein
MINLLVSRYRRIGNFFSAYWPSIWKYHVHVCLFYSLLGFVFAVVLWFTDHTIRGVHDMFAKLPTPFYVREYVGGAIILIFSVLVFAWILSTDRAPRIRSAARFSPRFVFALLGALAILGSFPSALYMVELFQPYIMGSGNVTQPLSAALVGSIMILYSVVLILLLVIWFSLRDVLLCLIYVGATIILFLVPLTGAIDAIVSKDTADLLVFAAFGVPAALGPPLALFVLLRGVRGRFTRYNMIFSLIFFPPLAAFFLVAMMLRLLRNGNTALSTDSSNVELGLSLVVAVVCLELVCWLGARLDKLPERR